MFSQKLGVNWSFSVIFQVSRFQVSRYLTYYFFQAVPSSLYLYWLCHYNITNKTTTQSPLFHTLLTILQEPQAGNITRGLNKNKSMVDECEVAVSVASLGDVEYNKYSQT